MRTRRIAILIDGGFFIKRLSKLVEAQYRDSAQAVAETAYWMCKRHVQKLIGEQFSRPRSRWLDHVYRMFYYDASPYDGIAHHPMTNAQIQFGRTPDAVFRNDLFAALRRQRKFALRLGKVTKEDGWHVRSTDMTKKLLRTREWLQVFDAAIQQATGGQAPAALTPAQAAQLQKIADAWRSLTADDLKLGLRQKGVDMRIGIDITTLTLKKQVDTIILITGDSDFVPAAKVARREGVEFILDPLWQSVNDDLHEHVDGVMSAFRNPASQRGEDEGDDLAPAQPAPVSPAATPPASTDP
ncbi:MAG: NYN domain-containing protein [Prosthecobacter sp.]|nr:NYN domain-containing protein [Prosthecobacter sp.]